MINPFIAVINQSLPEPQAGLLNGILFGVKAHLDSQLYQALITTGTVHIIALSGQNISILTNVISKLTIPLGRKKSSLITIICILAFILFVGPSSTIIRAAIMGCLSLLAVYFGKQLWSLLSLFLAAGVMLLFKPDLVAEISFQLSFLATLGIILYGSTPRSDSSDLSKQLWQDIRINFQTTIAAQVFTAPVILIHFHRFSIIAPITNVLIAWMITPIMVLGFITSIVGWLFLPLGQVTGYVVLVPLQLMVLIVDSCAKIPFASISF